MSVLEVVISERASIIDAPAPLSTSPESPILGFWPGGEVCAASSAPTVEDVVDKKAQGGEATGPSDSIRRGSDGAIRQEAMARSAPVARAEGACGGTAAGAERAATGAGRAATGGGGRSSRRSGSRGGGGSAMVPPLCLRA